MSSRVSGRPRRTRIYGANYDLGQSYYKSALDNLDKKQYVGSSLSSPITDVQIPIRKTRFALDDDNEFEDALQTARAKAHRAITEEPTLFDPKGIRARSVAFGGDEIDQDVQDSLSRIRASRQQKMTSLVNELSLDDEINLSQPILKSKIMKSTADDNDDFASSTKLRGRKILWRVEKEEPVIESKSITSMLKKSILNNESNESSSTASMRAEASKARLSDIESDIFERSEKLLEREKRAANLKKLLSNGNY